jgi:predicted AlkP superfamily pyrophosphatase or phosphodiesterase
MKKLKILLNLIINPISLIVSIESYYLITDDWGGTFYLTAPILGIGCFLLICTRLMIGYFEDESSEFTPRIYRYSLILFFITMIISIGYYIAELRDPCYWFSFSGPDDDCGRKYGWGFNASTWSAAGFSLILYSHKIFRK